MKNHALASLGMLVVVLMALATSTLARGEGNILRVGPGQDYETIQAAVDDARQGSRIFVYSRIGKDIEEYEESVKITTNNLQIIAQGVNVTVTPPPGQNPGFDVNADHVTVRGFEITGAEFAGIRFQGSHNTFAENIMYDFQGPGPIAIMCDDFDGGSDYNTIEGNSISGWGGKGIFTGIEVLTSSDALNDGNIIKNNTIVRVDNLGIHVNNGTGFQISGNYLQHIKAHHGIIVEASNNEAQGHHRILENTILSCGETGITLYAWPGTVLAHNHISDNEIAISGYGVYLSADDDAAVSDSLILGNIVSGHEFGGISLSERSDHNRILNNEVVANQVGVAIAGDNNLLVGNYMWDNVEDFDDTGEGNRWRNNTVSDY